MYALALVLFLLVWQLVSLGTNPIYLPSPLRTLGAAVQLVETNVLGESVLISLLRILVGWALSSAIGIPVGLVMGRLRLVQDFATPYIQFFRFIPPIAFVTLAIIWFGAGETSKVMLIVYTTVFVVVLNTMAGAASVKEGSVRAARSLGASDRQVLRHVVLPETVPYIITDMRLAMGNSFVTIVSAEMVAANAGIGYLIWSSRLYMRTDQIFVAIVALGTLGFLADCAFRAAAARLLGKYAVQ